MYTSVPERVLCDKGFKVDFFGLLFSKKVNLKDIYVNNLIRH